jgi:hypothetical protein
MDNKIRIFINSNGKLEAFAIDAADLFTVRVVIAREMEQDSRFGSIVEYMIRQREREGWDILSRCNVIGRLTGGHPDQDIISIKQYYKKRDAEITPLPLPEHERLMELGLA